MEDPYTYTPDETSDKLNGMEVNIAEVESDMHTPEFDRLTMRSPIPQSHPGTVIKHPHPHSHPHHKPDYFPDVSKRHDFPRSSSPTGSVRSAFSSRRVVRGSRWSSGFKRRHRSEVSRELTAQAESEFLALMELMSGISKRSSSLKEVWTKIISERESCISEMDRMYEQFEEYTETIERNEKEQHHHHHEHEERKKEISKLRLEITAAINTSSEYKKKLAGRDTELADVRRELDEFKDNFKYVKEEHEETTKKLEETRLKLVACEEARRKAEEDVKRHHGELRGVRQKFTELQTSHSELTTKYESTHKEVVSLKQSNTTLKEERHVWLHDKGQLEEDLRKCNTRNEELKRKVKEVTESYEKKVREVHEVQEIIHKTKYENEELHQKIKELTRQVEDEHCRWEDAEDRCGKWKLKWEKCERDVVSIREELKVIEIERTELRETIIKKTEELRQVIIEKERIEEDCHNARKDADDCHRQVLLLQESLSRTESILKEKTELIHTLHERIERIERERDDARSKCGDLEIEISEVKSSIISLKLEIETVTQERESFCEKLRECETRYEEVCETITEYQEGNSGSEYEITSLRNLLREVREQKEKAISMRSSADRERDEAILKYEAKCRDMEILEENFAQQLHSHSHGKSGGRTVSRTSTFFKGSRSVSRVHEHDHANDHDEEEL